MPVKMGKKRYKTFGKAKAAVKKKKGLSDKRAAAYVAATERYQGIDPKSGKHITPKKRKK